MMEKVGILTYLLNNIDCFEGVTAQNFYTLSTINTDDLGFISDKVSSVTPLLKQICNYALIAAVVNEEELKEIKYYIDEDNDMLNDTINIIENCFQYVQILQQENCHHPSILNMINLINGLTLYINFKKIIGKLIKITDEEFQDDLIDFGNIIDDQLDEITENLFERFINRLRKGIITNKKDLLVSLSNYTKNFFNTIMLLSTNTTIYQKDDSSVVCSGNAYIHVFKRDNRISQEYSLTLLKALESFATIMQKSEDYVTENYYDIDSEVNTLIEELNEAYILYQSYKYIILKDSYKEQRLLEKCKKM